MENRGNLIILSAPSGSGKSTLTRRLLDELDALEFSVSYTTRAPRAGEVDGKDYFFVSEETFMAMADRGEFLEWARYVGNCYGTSRDFVRRRQAAGRDVLLDIDIQGARQIKLLVPDAILVFVLPPDFGELERRLKARGLNDEEDLRIRLDRAREEITHWRDYDFVVVNEDVDTAVRATAGIIQSGRCRVSNNVERIREIVRTFGERTHD